MNSVKTFIRKKEDFTCEQCGASVKGDGYTNHCPQCLWSKHVDIFPGDRLESCGGMMKPVWIESEKQETVITHQCVRCSHKKRNKTSKHDSIDAQVALAKTKS
jgi:hypothetical protein